MEKEIYIQLLDVGTRVYRPVPARKIEDNLYRVEGFEIYDPEDEVWEFPLGTYVLVEEKEFNGEKVLVAIKKNVSNRH